MFDHGSLAGEHLARTGIVDYFRLPKRAWYWYRNEYTKIPPPEWPKPGLAAGLRLIADKTTIRGTDATDDVQLIVTVLDARGTPISNTPPVKLKIASGPGEFPTGRSITFAPDTGIPILDGQAAIEFRSYEGGDSVICATSPGLDPAEITIRTDGSPAFIPGRTPLVQDRPYVPFAGPNSTGQESRLGRDNPTQASSEANTRGARFANDGNSATFWQSVPTDANPSWQVFLEKRCVLSSVKITLPPGVSASFKIEVSDDGQAWRTATDSDQARNEGNIYTLSLPKGSEGAYVRVTFTRSTAGTPPGIAEFEATGVY